jgi:hypothetical protein
MKVHTSDVRRRSGAILAAILIVLFAHMVATSEAWRPAYHGANPRSTSHDEVRQPSGPPVNQVQETPSAAVIGPNGSWQRRNVPHRYAIAPVLIARSPLGACSTSAHDGNRPLGPARIHTFPLLI